jgi:CcmD family protein
MKMKSWFTGLFAALTLLVLLPGQHDAFAQASGSGSAGVAGGSAEQSAKTVDPEKQARDTAIEDARRAGILGDAASTPPVAAPVAAPVPAALTAAELRKTCADAMNADKEFEATVLRVLDEKKFAELTKAQQKFAGIQIEAAARVAKNERHVVLAYAAIWLAAVAFLLFLWRRQRGLHGQIEALRSDLAAALKGNK